MRIYLLGSEEYAVNQVQFIHIQFCIIVMFFFLAELILSNMLKQNKVIWKKFDFQPKSVLLSIKCDVRGWYSLNSSNSGFLFALLHFWLKKGGEGPSFWRNQSKQKE